MSDSGIPYSPEDFTASLTRILMSRGQAREVALLAISTAVSYDYVSHDNWNGGITYWRLVIQLPIRFYAPLTEQERHETADSICEIANELLVGIEDHGFHSVLIAPQITEADNFREEAIHWLNGEGVNNQGRVRSTNIAARERDGLLFRSTPEILMYESLKTSGVTFAPLPVFLRGGPSYRRVEPDFIIWQDGILVLLEIDGDTVHKESPAEAAERVNLFEEEGAHIRRLPSSKCDTKEKAEHCVSKLLQLIQKLKDQR